MWTNFAAARACRPSGFTIVTAQVVTPSLAVAAQQVRGDPDRVAPVLAHLARQRQQLGLPVCGRASLISIGRLTPVITSTCR